MKTIIAIIFIAIFSFNAIAEVVHIPDNSKTNVYIAEIDEDWVRLILPTPDFLIHEIKPLLQDIYASPQHLQEIMGTAEAACRLYNRTSVLLSQTWEGTLGVTHVEFLFGCATP